MLEKHAQTVDGDAGNGVAETIDKDINANNFESGKPTDELQDNLTREETKEPIDGEISSTTDNSTFKTSNVFDGDEEMLMEEVVDLNVSGDTYTVSRNNSVDGTESIASNGTYTVSQETDKVLFYLFF